MLFLFSQIMPSTQQTPLRNWAGNLTYSNSTIVYPRSTEEIQELVKKNDRVKVLGTRHCFNDIADSNGVFISLRDMKKIMAVDEATQTVTVEAGITYGELSPWLNERGYALHNLASLPHISVAGAVATATHGSGMKNGNLSTAVVALEIVTGNGDVLTLTKKDNDFYAVGVGLGAFGIITKITLQIQPALLMCQYVYERLPLQNLQTHFDAILSAGYSVSLFTDWNPDHISTVWIKALADNNNTVSVNHDFFGASPAKEHVHPIPGVAAENCTEQMGIPGHWYERLPHFKMGFTPSNGKELQAEYFVPYRHAADACFAVQKIGALIQPHLLITEIRTIAADEYWLSPCYKQNCLAIHFTLKQDTGAETQLLPVIEKTLAPFQARPHWGKLFTMTAAELALLYPKMNDFKKLIAKYDPLKKFSNAYLVRNIYT